MVNIVLSKQTLGQHDDARTMQHGEVEAEGSQPVSLCHVLRLYLKKKNGALEQETYLSW